MALLFRATKKLDVEGDIYQPPILQSDVTVDFNIHIAALLVGLT